MNYIVIVISLQASVSTSFCLQIKSIYYCNCPDLSISEHLQIYDVKVVITFGHSSHTYAFVYGKCVCGGVVGERKGEKIMVDDNFRKILKLSA